MKILSNIRIFIVRKIPTMIHCLEASLPYNATWQIRGKIKVNRPPLRVRMLNKNCCGTIIIGKNFQCNNKLDSNSIGVFQRCFFNISTPGSRIVIGDNVGISGSTICAKKGVVICNDVNIGSGCIITDSDAHPICWQDRIENRNEKTKIAPIHICDKVFIGARCIILKGVTIGEGSVIGAGSVVASDIPSGVIAAGNPCRVLKVIE